MNEAIRKYLSEIGSKGGKAGTGKAKARTSKQAKTAKGRERHALGGNHWKASITDVEAIAIKSRFKLFICEIMRDFNISSEPALRSLLLGKTWRKFSA
jgi:hypothetical protein